MTEFINFISPNITSTILLTITLLSVVISIEITDIKKGKNVGIVFIIVICGFLYTASVMSTHYNKEEHFSTIESLENNFTGVVFFCEDQYIEFKDTEDVVKYKSKDKNINYLRYNIDNNRKYGTSNNYDITKYPTVIAFQNGVETKRIEGKAQSKTYKQLINSIPEVNNIIE